MATRRNLKGVAANVAASFVSRNNDIGGYWAVGKLHRLAIERGEQRVALDFLSGHVSPANNICTEMSKTFREMLFRNVVSAGLSRVNIVSAVCVIEFDKFDRAAHKQFRYVSPAPGASRPCVCTLSIVDDRSKVYSASVGSWSLPHSPLREMRRRRAPNAGRQGVWNVSGRLAALIRLISAPWR